MDLNAPLENEAGHDAGDPATPNRASALGDPDDPAAVDLRPRTTTDPAAALTRKRRSKVLPGAILALVLVAGAIILFQGLSNATVYLCNANEVGVRDDCSPDQRFRLQGTVEDDVTKQENLLRFSVAYGGATVPVRYEGDPGGIFQVGIPVVVEGRMGADGVFQGDRILVKHTEQYREENPDRVPEGAP